MVATDRETETPSNLIFVHGTFAQRLSDRGDAWWQLDSGFSQRTEEKLRGLALPSREAFHWSGENSDVFRVFDSSHLFDRLCRENEKGPFHVIAHSHGGMVLFHALMLAVEKKMPLENLRSWITVGTPFIFYSPSFKRISVGYALPVVFASFAVYMSVLQLFNSLLIAALGPLGVVIFFFAYAKYLVKSSSEKLRWLEKETIRQFGSRWLGVRSKHDEAILLLKSALSLKTSITPYWRDGPSWTYSRGGATKVPGRVPRRAWSRKGPSREDPAFHVHPNSWLRGKDFPDSGWKMQARSWLVTKSLFWPVEIVLSIVRLGYRNFFTPRIDGFVAGLTKTRLLGDDAPFFIATFVTDVPSRSPGLSAAELPPNIDEDLLRQADSSAKYMISDVRQNYFSQLALAPSADVFGSWQNLQSDPTSALVHCLYFELRSCQDLIVAALLEASGGSPKAIHNQWLKRAHAATQKLMVGVSSKG